MKSQCSSVITSSASACDVSVPLLSSVLDRLDPETHADRPTLERRSQNVLMLSTDLSFSKLVRSYLEHSSIAVLHCTAAGRAESFLANRVRTDLWMIDVEDLGIDALYIATRVRECRPEAPVLILEGDRPDRELLERFMFEEWARIAKQSPLTKLFAAVRRLLDRGVARKDCRSLRIKAPAQNLNVA
jgi:DNA-binding response OmpR family regulator